MAAIRAITLDLDDTLWDTPPVIRRAEEALRRWLGEHYPKIVDRVPASRVAELRQAVVAEHADLAHDLSFLRREVIRRMGLLAGYNHIDVDAAFDVFDRHRNDLELFPDVLPALRSLKARYTLVAVTNGNARLERIGIDDLFDGFVSARSAGAAKPSRQIFDVAVRHGGAAASETLHVGDHPEYDVVGARAAGLKTVWLNRQGASWPGHLAPPDSVCTNLVDLERQLQADD